MSQALALSPAQLLAEVDKTTSLEQLAFIWSPFGILTTTIGIFALSMGSYAIVALLAHVPLLAFEGHAVTFLADTRMAFALSVLTATILGVQRYARKKDCDEAPVLVRVMRGSKVDVENVVITMPNRQRLALSTAAGLLLGAGATYALYPHAPIGRFFETPATFYWFAVAIGLVCAFFVRGIELTRAGGSAFGLAIENDLKIDLLRIDELAVIGRAAARLAFIWFACSAAACLLFIGDGFSAFTIVLLLACMAMGVWIFVATMERVHRKIRAAKSDELRSLRDRIDLIRAQAYAHADAAVKLHGLLAYEARIVAAPEWPFDQPTLVRVGASALILTVPWFGQAIAGYIVENANRFIH